MVNGYADVTQRDRGWVGEGDSACWEGSRNREEGGDGGFAEEGERVRATLRAARYSGSTKACLDAEITTTFHEPRHLALPGFYRPPYLVLFGLPSSHALAGDAYVKELLAEFLRITGRVVCKTRVLRPSHPRKGVTVEEQFAIFLYTIVGHGSSAFSTVEERLRRGIA
jgi:hypothetical protein